MHRHKDVKDVDTKPCRAPGESALMGNSCMTYTEKTSLECYKNFEHMMDGRPGCIEISKHLIKLNSPDT